MNLEFNKIFAALLVAGIAAAGANFISGKVVHSESLEADAVPIEVTDSGSAGSAGPAGPTGPEPVLALLAGADVARGEKLSKACAACHSFNQGGANKVGPNLWEIVGREKGKHEGFSYSSSMAGKGGTWTYSDLNHFLYKPKDFVSGTKMTYVGMKKVEDRATIIAWLRTLSDSPVALPDEAAVSTEVNE
ncbi:MAG: cytochrome c family protein [Rhodospirillales bacterium]|nr:cytochrome c family protein [Rhodospirillales bacterium]